MKLIFTIFRFFQALTRSIMAGGGRSGKKIANDGKGGKKAERKKTAVTITKAKKQRKED